MAESNKEGYVPPKREQNEAPLSPEKKDIGAEIKKNIMKVIAAAIEYDMVSLGVRTTYKERMNRMNENARIVAEGLDAIITGEEGRYEKEKEVTVNLRYLYGVVVVDGDEFHNGQSQDAFPAYAFPFEGEVLEHEKVRGYFKAIQGEGGRDILDLLKQGQEYYDWIGDGRRELFLHQGK